MCVKTYQLFVHVLIYHKTHPNLQFEEKDDRFGNVSVVGAVTQDKKNICINVNYDTKMNRIHEIFHTFGFEHPKKVGGKGGIMNYPPQNPSIKDAEKIAKSKFLQTIIK